MSAPAFRAAAAVFVVGLLFVWLVRPLGNPCPDVDKLPGGSEGSSAPSFAPPLTRICTYTTPEGTQARKRYVPVLDLVALLFVAGLLGAAIGMAGPGRPEGGAEREHAPRRDRAPRPEQPEPSPIARVVGDERSGRERDAAQRERDALERERARQEREARRGR